MFQTPYSLLYQPLWRFIDAPADGRLLVYRSDDIKNLSRVASPKVCGYIHAEDRELFSQVSRGDGDGHNMSQAAGEICCCCFLSGILQVFLSEVCADNGKT